MRALFYVRVLFFFFFCLEHRQEREAEQSVPVAVQGQHVRASGQIPKLTRPEHGGAALLVLVLYILTPC